jgi:hypothetical protein
MKYYEVGTLTIYTRDSRGQMSTEDEFTAYSGTSLDEARKAYEQEVYKFDRYLTASEKKNAEVFAREYNLPDDIDINDEDEVFNALYDEGFDDLYETIKGEV